MVRYQEFIHQATQQETRELSYKQYQVKKIISNYAVELNLSSDLHIHPVFYINLFEPTATDDPHPGHVQPPRPPIKVDRETKYEVTTIIDSRLFGKTKKL